MFGQRRSEGLICTQTFEALQVAAGVVLRSGTQGWSKVSQLPW